MNEILTPQQIAKEAKYTYHKRNFAVAAQSFEAARQGYLSAKDPVMAAEMANNRSVALLQAGENEEALLAIEGVENVFLQAGDPKRQAMTLANRAAALEALGRLDEAEKTYWMAAEIFNQLGETELKLPLMQSISALQLRTGRHLQAVASMYAGVEKIEKPTLKQRFLKRLLEIPFHILNKQSNELPNGNNHNS